MQPSTHLTEDTALRAEEAPLRGAMPAARAPRLRRCAGSPLRARSGKGIRHVGENVRRKAGKSFGT
jgi:hypothetical protein